MIYENEPVVFAVPKDQKLTVYSKETQDMIQFSVEEPKTFMDKVKAKFDKTPSYTTITSDKVEDILQDESANIVQMNNPGVVNFGFINENGELTSGAAVHLITAEKNTSDSGFWVHGISDNRLNEYAMNNGVTQFLRENEKVTEDMFDATPCDPVP